MVKRWWTFLSTIFLPFHGFSPAVFCAIPVIKYFCRRVMGIGVLPSVPFGSPAAVNELLLQFYGSVVRHIGEDHRPRRNHTVCTNLDTRLQNGTRTRATVIAEKCKNVLSSAPHSHKRIAEQDTSSILSIHIFMDLHGFGGFRTCCSYITALLHRYYLQNSPVLDAFRLD